MRILTMTADGKIYGESINGSLKDFQRVVGGYVEAINLSDTITIWCNEEGKLNGSAYNHNATLVFRHYFGNVDVIAGDVFFTGGVGENGETKEIGESDFFAIKKLAESDARKFLEDHIKIIVY